MDCCPERLPELLFACQPRAKPVNPVLLPPCPTPMPLVTAGQQPVFADDRAAFDALAQRNLDLRQIVFLPRKANPGSFRSSTDTRRCRA